ncbi:type III-D CRISPR-associated protein Csx19, partial [Candidatus Protofrankia californiensis]|uniref:type III-D CRISPR-associated protein Csx19 n=1 Tax=Candidatus Protofrankia californiensis TaxID=1839754 RepID=UPI0013ED6483
LGDAVALLASAKKYTVARLSGGRLSVPGKGSFADGAGVAGTSAEEELPLSTSGSDAVFEARIFNKDAELRWLHEGDGLGTAVLLSESPDICRPLGEALDPLKAIERIDNRYLLWGRPLRSHDSGASTGPLSAGPLWVRLAEARIGLLDVPVSRAPRENECVFLRTVEYVTTEPEHGNAYVAEERLVELFLAPPEQSKAAGSPQPDRLPEATR